MALDNSEVGKYFPVILLVLLFNIVVLTFYKALAKRAVKGQKRLLYAVLRTFNQTFFAAQFLVLVPLCIVYWSNKTGDAKDGGYLRSGFEQSLILLLFFLVRNIKRLLLHGKMLPQKQKKRAVRRLSATFYIALFLWGLLSLERVYIHQLHSDKETSHFLFRLLKIYTIWCVVGMLTYAFHIIAIFSNKLLERKKMPLGKVFLQAAHWPIIVLCGACILIYTLKTFLGIVKDYSDSGPESFQFLKNLSGYYRNVLLLSFIYTMFRLVRTLQYEFLSGAFTTIAPNKTMVVGLGHIARFILGLIFCVVCWNMMSGETVGIGTILGSTTLGLAIVVRPILESYVAGVANYFEGGYSIGDWVYFTDKKIEGVIEEIKARVIVLRTFDKRVLYVPHSLFVSSGVVNAGRMTHRRVLQKIPVGWITDSDALDRILLDIRSLVYNSPDFDKNQALMVHFTGFGTQGLEITIYALTKTKNWHASLNVQEHILREAKKIITKHAGAPPMQVRANYTMLPKPTDLPNPQ